MSYDTRYDQDGCPIHKIEWKVVPPGISKKTGKPYGSFKVCQVPDCKEKPASPPLVASEPLDNTIMTAQVDRMYDAQEKRSYRIERQHSQEMALRYITIKGKTDFKWTELVEVIDKFMEDLERE